MEKIEKFVVNGKEYIRVYDGYEKPKVYAESKDFDGPTRPCRPNNKPSGRPCNPPAPGSR